MTRHRILLIATLAATSAACSATAGDGTERTDPLTIVDEDDQPFEGAPVVRGVSVHDGLRVEVAVAAGPSDVTLTTDANLFGSIEGQLDDEGVLTIEVTGGIEPTIPPTVRITTSAIDFVAARDEDTSALVTDVAAERFGLAASEGADVEVTGTCDELVIVASNDAAARASALACARGRIDAQGGSTVDAQLTESVSVAASGGSTIRVTGMPTDVEEALTDGSTLTVE